MQTRAYDAKDGQKVWLAPSEAEALLDLLDPGETQKALVFRLGLHGLRTQEILGVRAGDLRHLEAGDGHVLVVESAKDGGEREPPIADALANDIMRYRSDAGLLIDEALIDARPRTIRDWIEGCREPLREATGEAGALELGMHDLRRTWATETYYSLAVAGVPIAEQLTMSWGGWEQTSTGRETFRQNYLGPVPDHVTARAVEHLAL